LYSNLGKKNFSKHPYSAVIELLETQHRSHGLMANVFEEEKRRRDHRAAMVSFGRTDERGQTCHTTRWFLATQREEHVSLTLEFWVGKRWQSIPERRISQHNHCPFIQFFRNRRTEPMIYGVTWFENVRVERRWHMRISLCRFGRKSET
jgi:hypothetical protein